MIEKNFFTPVGPLWDQRSLADPMSTSGKPLLSKSSQYLQSLLAALFILLV